jgi:hypothetical protein
MGLDVTGHRRKDNIKWDLHEIWTEFMLLRIVTTAVLL